MCHSPHSSPYQTELLPSTSLVPTFLQVLGQGGQEAGEPCLGRAGLSVGEANGTHVTGTANVGFRVSRHKEQGRGGTCTQTRRAAMRGTQGVDQGSSFW